MATTQNLDWIYKVMDVYSKDCKRTEPTCEQITDVMDDWFDDLLNNTDRNLLNAGIWRWMDSMTITMVLEPSDCPSGNTYYRTWQFPYLVVGHIDTTLGDYNRAMQGI